MPSLSAETWDNSGAPNVLETRAAPLTTPLLKGAGGMAGRKGTPEQRFWAKVQKSDGCWLWTGKPQADGYGYIRTPNTSKAHRFSWELANGRPVPKGLLVCHTCDVTLCVRPDHLFLGSERDNINDAVSKRRFRNQKITHCLRGHEYTVENTAYSPMSNGRRQRKCRTCMREHSSR